MTFKLRSGNKPQFKQVGSSPVKDMKTGKYEHRFESPAKQRVIKGGEGQDQDKIFDEKGNHIGNWVNDKKVMFNDKPVEERYLKRKKNYKSLTPEQKKRLEDAAKVGVEGVKKGLKKESKSPTKQKYDLSKATVTESKSAEFDRKGLVKDKVGPVAEQKKKSEGRKIIDWLGEREKAQTEGKVKKAYETLQTKKTKKDIKTKESNTKMKNLIKKMIDKGWTPSKMADASAISKGGVQAFKKKKK